jgi:hypothetical protein
MMSQEWNTLSDYDKNRATALYNQAARQKP